MTKRNELILTLNACLFADRLDFGRALAADWLASWPGDWDVRQRLADMELRQQSFAAARTRLESLLIENPEFQPTYPLLASAVSREGDAERAKVLEQIGDILAGVSAAPNEAEGWIQQLQLLVHARRAGDVQTALALAVSLAAMNIGLPLPTVLHVRTLLELGRKEDAIALAESANSRWPDCVPFQYLCARSKIADGDISGGVALLHRTASQDPLGQLAAPFLGHSHPYQSLWPEELTLDINRPIPADVAAYLGGNQLGEDMSSSAPTEPSPGEEPQQTASEHMQETSETARKEDQQLARPEIPEETASPSKLEERLPAPEEWEAFKGPNPGDQKTLPDEEREEDQELLEETREAFDAMASRLKAKRYRKDIDVRVPAYIVLTSRSRLTQQCGEETFARVDEAVMQLVETVRSRSGWTAYRIYVDDPSTLTPFELSPVDPGNAWQIKMRLADLDKALSKRGEMIGSLFIIGSDDIIPYHRLPNPTDDDDDDIPSDNPYATSDNNYLAPEWPVGRLPFNAGDEIADMLRLYASHHRVHNRLRRPIARFRLWLRRRIDRMITNQSDSLGYSASIWRKASLAVYKSIGEPHALVISPPVHAERLPNAFLRPARFSYYNLHGLEDSPEWFGQKDPSDGPNAVDFPVALRPEDVVDRGRAPQVIYSEACYGANTLAKTADSALSLKFLTSGTKVFIGSTKISYGSVTTPLIAADLLGRYFWENLRASAPVGEALRRAKLNLASEMHRRQGFLDAEDQKTLISFVLFGDPLFEVDQKPDLPGAKVILRKTTRPSRMKTANSLKSPLLSEDEFDLEALSRVKSIVASYLPGMADASCTIRSQHYMETNAKQAVLDPIGTVPVARLSPRSSNAYVFTFSKSITHDQRLHQHYARLTMNAEGKIIKLAVSR